MTEEKTEQAVEQAAAPETKKEEAPAVSLERTLELSVPSAQVRELAQKHLRGYAKDARMPGFRKGHVPMKQVEAMYGMRAFDEALNELVGQAWSKAAQASGLQIAARRRLKLSKAPMATKKRCASRLRLKFSLKSHIPISRR